MIVEHQKITLTSLNLDQVKIWGHIKGQTKIYPVGLDDLTILELFQKNASIADVVKHFLNQNILISFASLKKLLEFLVHEGFIQNAALKQLFFVPPVESKSIFEDIKEKVFGREEEINIHQEIKLSPFFRSLNKETLDLFLKNMKIVETPQAGVRICQQGQLQRSLFCLIRGSVSVIKGEGSHAQKVVGLEAGSVFGETGFFLNEPRTANVVTASPCLIAMFKYIPEVYDELIKKDKASQLKERFWVVHALLKSSFLKGVSDDAFDSVVFAGSFRKVQPLEVIVKEGDKGSSFFIVVQGKLSVKQSGKSIRKLAQGDGFGEMALFFKGIRTATVQAETECMLMEVPVAQFYKILTENLLLACEIENLFLSRYREDQQRQRLAR